MDAHIDFLIVGSADDLLSQKIVSDFAQRGKQVRILEPMAAAQLFTVAVRQGQVDVSPDIPLLLRPITPELRQPDFDQAFHQGEALSTLWAAAAACQSPVLNRPTPRSLWGLTSVSTVLTLQRAQFPIDTQECFTGHRPSASDLDVILNAHLPIGPHADSNRGQQSPTLKVYEPMGASKTHPTSNATINGSSGNLEQTWFTQDMGNFQVTQAPEIPAGEGPYRSRQTYRQGQYEQVVVLVDRAWRNTQVPLHELALENRSIELLRNLELDFGVVIWNISPNREAATLAKIEVFPTFEQVAWMWQELSAHLYQEIFE
jgi:hypothetical protein